MLAILRETEVSDKRPLWCAGEAAAMHVVRNRLFKELGLPRSLATVRGYWKARENTGAGSR
jgi:NADPH-dependent ferric siderophore reductase